MIGSFVAVYLEQQLVKSDSNDQSRRLSFLWFLVVYTDQNDKAIELVMDLLPITDVLVRYIDSKNAQFFTTALRVIGNVISHEKYEFYTFWNIIMVLGMNIQNYS